jgi:hypothetical protein
MRLRPEVLADETRTVWRALGHRRGGGHASGSTLDRLAASLDRLEELIGSAP